MLSRANGGIPHSREGDGDRQGFVVGGFIGEVEWRRRAVVVTCNIYHVDALRAHFLTSFAPTDSLARTMDFCFYLREAMLLEGTSYNDGFKLTGPFWGLPYNFRGCVQYEASLGLVSGIFWYLQLYGRRRLVIALSISSREDKNGA